MACMTDEREDPETETDESKEQPSKDGERSPKTGAGEHGTPPTEAIILKSSD